MRQQQTLIFQLTSLGTNTKFQNETCLRIIHDQQKYLYRMEKLPKLLKNFTNIYFEFQMPPNAVKYFPLINLASFLPRKKHLNYSP